MLFGIERVEDPQGCSLQPASQPAVCRRRRRR